MLGLVSFTYSGLRISVIALHFLDCFYATMSEHKTLKISSLYLECTLVGVEPHVMVLKGLKNSLEILDML